MYNMYLENELAGAPVSLDFVGAGREAAEVGVRIAVLPRLSSRSSFVFFSAYSSGWWWEEEDKLHEYTR